MLVVVLVKNKTKPLKINKGSLWFAFLRVFACDSSSS
jgi:hypothetical protein